MNARFVWSSAKKDLVRRAREPMTVLLWMGIPVILGGLLSLLGGGDGAAPKARVLLVDQDDSLLSGLLGTAFAQAGLFEVEEVELEEGRARIDRGDGSGLLVVPEGFGEALLREEPSTLRLVTNPGQRILPGLIEEMLSILVDGSFYLHRVLGEDLQAMIDGPQGGEGAALFGNAFVSDLSVRINERMERADRFLFPPVLELEVVEPVEEDSGPEMTFGTLFFPAMFFMALFFVAQGLSDDVWRERAQGTLRRVVTSPPQTAAFLLGKVLAGTAVIGIVGLSGGLLALFLFEFELAAVALGLLWTTLTGAVLLLVMMLIQLLATTQRGGSMLSNVIVFPLVMIGGAFFPFEAMPSGMAAIGKRTPNGWALMEFKWLLEGGFEAGRLGLDLLALFGVGAALFWICAHRLRTRFAVE